MALSFAHGAIQWLTTDALNADKVVSGLGFQPEAIRLYWLGIQSATDAASEAVTMQRGVGFTNGTTHRAVVTTSIDAAGSMDTAAIVISNGVVVTIDGAGAVNGRLSVQSIDSGGFTLNVDDVAPQNITVFYEAWAGDITNVTIGDIAEPAATGTQNYTATGFTSTDDDSQVVMLAGCQSVQAVGTGEAKDSGFYAGFATGTAAAEQVVVVGNNDEGSANSDTDGYCQSGQCSAMIVLAGGTSVNAAATLSAFGTDFFTLNWTARAVTDRRSIYMAIKGGSWRAGELTINSLAIGNTAAVSGLPFVPVGLSLLGRSSAESTADTAGQEDVIGFGSGSSTTSRRSMSVFDVHGAGNADINTVVDYDAVLAFPSAAGALESAYDINAMNSDGFQLIVDTAANLDPIWIGYLTFGDAASAQQFESTLTAALSFVGSQTKVTSAIRTAALSFVGAQTKVTSALRTATLSFVGAVTKAVSTAKTAALSFVGVLTKSASRALSGTLSFTAALVQSFVFVRSLTGTLSFSGTATTILGKVFTGTLSLAGALAKRTGKGLSGALSFVGAAAKLTSHFMTGALSFVGAIVKRTARAVTATLSFVGAFAAIQVVTRAFTATLSFSGAVTKRTAKGLSGALAFVGALVKMTGRSMTAALSFAGNVAKRTTLAVTASVSFAGAFLTGSVFSQALSATLSFVGAITSLRGKALTAALSFTGAVALNTAKAFTGVLSFSGLVERVTTVIEAIFGWGARSRIGRLARDLWNRIGTQRAADEAKGIGSGQADDSTNGIGSDKG